MGSPQERPLFQSTTAQLTAELLQRKNEILSGEGLINRDVYGLISEIIPISCTDFMPVRVVNGQWQIGVIERATGPEAGKMGVLGGGIYKGKSITEAINYHLKKDLGFTGFRFFGDLDESHPFYVEQYFHGRETRGESGYDPTKQSTALTFLIEIDEDPVPRDEASKFLWIAEDQIPEETAYNQKVVMQKAFDYLNKCG